MMAASLKKPSNPLTKSLIFTHDKLVPIIICIIGATTQVSTLFTLYFSWPTTTVIELYRPNVINLPSISLCFVYKLSKDVILETIFSRDTLSDIGQEISSLDLTLDELDHLTADLHNFVESCKVANASIDANQLFNMVDCENVSQVKVALAPFLKCFTFFAGKHNPYEYYRNDFYDDYFLLAELNANHSSGLSLVFVHDNDEEVAFNNGSPDMAVLDKTFYNKFVLTYYTKTNSELGFPYSNCMDYEEVHNKSRRTLIKQCMYTAIYLEYLAFPELSLVSVPNYLSNVTFDKGIPTSKFRAACEAIYHQPECKTHLFETRILKAEFDPTIDPGIILIKFGYPLGLQSDIMKSKKFNDIEFFCYVASIISLWLEVSILSVAKFLFHNLRKLGRNILRRRREAAKKRALLARYQQKQRKMNKSKAKISWISNGYEREFYLFYPKYMRSYGPVYPINYY
uniref:Uncharacterized protein n=1 Tax=Tetranychus urticae TaxID=32264 RepID=T1K9W2_TETUR